MDLNFTLLGEMITFLLFVLFTMKFVWPPLMKAMQERQKKIADGLESAERGKRELDLAQHKAVEILHDTRSEAQHILDQANTRADQLVNNAKAEGRIESKRIVDDAQVEIAHDVTKAKETLRSDFANLVLAGAEKILETDVNQSAHEKLLDELISEI